ncbi:hypothetical protein J2Z22_003973 [Paenibacillus forsythiae]|uniref:Uncharacterized protein n=1 Tax=Paenibacillus forsythiae TaxID=365616 RepID=A0ABU3HC28_9BACL|nr:hypothetical protein [Paenibacillus forsythiae]
MKNMASIQGHMFYPDDLQAIKDGERPQAGVPAFFV